MHHHVRQRRLDGRDRVGRQNDLRRGRRACLDRFRDRAFLAVGHFAIRDAPAASTPPAASAASARAAPLGRTILGVYFAVCRDPPIRVSDFDRADLCGGLFQHNAQFVARRLGFQAFEQPDCVRWLGLEQGGLIGECCQWENIRRV